MKKNVHEIEIKLEKEWKDALEASFKAKNKEVEIPGFRKGNAPKEVYLKKFGIESLYSEAVDKSINVAYQKLLKENDLVPVCEPTVDVTGISDTNVIFKFTIITKPEVKLTKYKDLGIKCEKAKVSAKEVEEEITHLQEHMADMVVKENGSIVKGDTAIIDFKGYVDGKELEGGTGENYPLEIGSGSFIPGFEEGLIGKKKDDKVTLNLKFPENYTEELKNKDVKFDVTINEVKTKVLPEINESFFEDLGYTEVKTLDDLKKQVKKNLEEHKQAHLDDEFIDKCLEAASKNLEVELNDEIISDEVHRMIDEFENQLKMQGMNINTYFEITKTSHEDLHKQMMPEAKKRVEYRYLLEEIANQEKIDFTEKEVKEEAKNMAEKYGVTEEELFKAFGSLDVVKYDMKMHKALEILKENN